MERPETLARLFFTLVADRNRVDLAALLHPDVVFQPLSIPGVHEGRDNVMNSFYETVYSWPLYDVYATTFEHHDENTVLTRGRLRWMSNGQLHDSHAVWTITFQDGYLYRLTSGEPSNHVNPQDSLTEERDGNNPA